MSKESNKFDAFFKSFADAENKLDFSLGTDKDKEISDTISTGSYALDDALGGEGGIPTGRLSQYYGPAGSGKSLLAMLTIKEAQKKDPDSGQVWIDSEGTLSTDWAKSLGIDLSRLMIVKGDTAVNGRACFEFLLGVPREDAKTHILKGKVKEGLFDKIINKELNINVIVLDSLGGLIPPGEDISIVGKMNISLMARFLSTTLKKVSLEVNKSNASFIIINHKRDSMNAYGPDHTYMGGNSFTHFLAASIYLEAVQRKDALVLDSKENKVGQLVRASVEKTKAGAQRKCEFKLHFGEGIIDQHEEIVNLALDYDIVKKPTSMSYEYDGQKWVGVAKFMEAVKDDKALFAKLAEQIKAARKNKWNKKAPPEEKAEDESTKVVEKPKKSSRDLSAVAKSEVAS